MHPAVIRNRSDNQSNNELVDDADSPVEGLEEGTLALQTFVNGVELHPRTDIIWKRLATRAPNSHRFAPDKQLIFEILFARLCSGSTFDCPGGSEPHKKYVAYEMFVWHGGQKESAGFDERPITIDRRYTDFRQLYDALQKPALSELRFPSKALIGNFSASLVAERVYRFELLLERIIGCPALRESPAFLAFLQDGELRLASRALDAGRPDVAVPMLANTFALLGRVYTDRAHCVLLVLGRLVAACTEQPLAHPDAERWCELALHRFEHVSDADVLVMYLPLVQTCVHLWWQRGRDNATLLERLAQMQRQGVNTKATKTLRQVIHEIDARSEMW